MKNKKKLLTSIAVACGVLVLLCGAIVAFKMTGVFQKAKVDVEWYEEEGKEFLITTAEELRGIAKLSEKHDFKGQTIKLGADIVLNEGDYNDWKQNYLKCVWKPIEGFAGTFDGQGHTISGLYCVANGYKVIKKDVVWNPSGMFNSSTDDAVIRDFRIVNSYYSSSNKGGIGSVIGRGNGTVESVYSNATIVTTKGVNGGMVGEVQASGSLTIRDCQFDGEIQMVGDDAIYTGGIVGYVNSSAGTNTIEHCLFTGTITSDKKDGQLDSGGIVGVTVAKSRVVISDCLFAGTIDVAWKRHVGSIVGYHAGALVKMTNVYSDAAGYAATIGVKYGKFDGYPIELVSDCFKGNHALQWTELDFDKYWTVVEEGTPMLRTFADKVVDSEEMQKAYDTAWYDSKESTYTISTLDEWYGFYVMSAKTKFEGKTIYLGADISFDGKPYYPIQEFAGTFDGKGHTISGIDLKTCQRDAGLFTRTATTAVLKDFRLTNSYFECTADGIAIMGSIVGYADGRLDTIYSNAVVVADALICGGLVGNVVSRERANIVNCWYDGEMRIGDNGGYIGGIAGQVEDGSHAKIMHCLYSGKITGTKEEGSMTIGGMVGVISDDYTNVTISDCLNAGFITTPTGSGVGTMASTILPKTTLTLENCYAIKESTKTAYVTASEHGTKVNEGYTRYTADLVGYKAYEFTLLDFDKYWAVNKKGTPILQSFAENIPSLAGHKRKIDITWYKEDAKQYVLKTMEELYGLYHMSFITNFEGKTVRLGADITVNTGTASDWQASAPANPWYPIQKFAGTFDGKGHTINGIYLKTDIQGSGFFAATTPKSVLKNFKLCNSYFESTSEKPAILGSVVGKGEGRFDTIYTDAHIVANALICGGVVGNVSSKEPVTITNCWFDGVMTLGDNGGYIGGITSQVEDGSVAEITHCLYTGTITGTKEKGSMTMGGMVGVISDDNTKVTVSDCLNAGYITTPTGGGVGTMASTILPKTTLILNNCYAIKESSKTSYVTASEHGTKVNEGYTRYAADLTGYKAYEFTLLDFDKYWAVVEDGTPILKSFAKSVPSLAGHNRKINIDWYKEDAKQYVIKTMEELYGLYHMSFITNFEGKTVRLGADITVNTGTASDWQASAPANPWYPIQKFAGTFDGKGHTINGIYLKTDIQGSGFFAATTPKSVLKNFKLCNSYFESTSEKPAILGSVVGKGEGRFDTIYTDAHIVANALICGGVVGNVSSKEPVTITNCWFDGVMTLGDNGGYIGGITSQVEDGTIAEITHCLNSGTISGTKEKGSMTMGGIVGVVSDAGTKVRIVDSLNVGNITSPTGGGIGTMVSTILKDTVVTLDNCYAASDSTKFGNVCASKHGTLEGSCTQQPKSGLRGYNAYYVTYLDFKDYWAVNLEGTPILQSFAKTIPSLAGLEKMNTAWYDENKTEFVLNTVAELYGWSELSKTIDFKGKTIKLGKDIVLNEGNASDWSKKAPACSWYPIQNFAGTFDGQGYTLSGVYYSNPQSTGYGYGLFTETKDGAVVKNFSLKNSYICANLVVGSIAGKPRGTFENIYSDAIVESTGQFAGGLFGSLETGEGQTTTITNCWFDGSVHSSVGNAGGIIGYVRAETSQNNILSNCLVTGTVSSNGRYVGGLCGQIYNGTPMLFEKCLADATLSGEAYVGGIIGFEGMFDN